ncbi:DUF6705 family protein [Flavobacterium sedimenticola]|uniref:DUF6705 domain-containing protein n=1 Tax=Flavobacterium sedimenticola TaxID=3043286 RepID=A0ABT6XN19_9FLAO|nr:DUF6705 family protein [Flavobacterium sedimenticola]MDI9256479.1 hypothetical protein [Flavobacterium sedimenticola]
MKTTIKLLFVLLLTSSCKAQTIDISQQNGENATGVYYKDIQNLLNTFEGTYLYSEGTASLKIIFRKQVMSSPANNRFREDLLVGEYQYIENGIEKSNTLSNLNIFHSNGWKYSIDGNTVLVQGDPGCQDCLPNEKALRLGIVEESTNNSGFLIVRKTNVAGQEAIEVRIIWDALKTVGANNPAPIEPTIPGELFVLLKQ